LNLWKLLSDEDGTTKVSVRFEMMIYGSHKINLQKFIKQHNKIFNSILKQFIQIMNSMKQQLTRNSC